jgi:peptidoglycan hydrolase-like protein with peptidoglycan-binding domain
MRFWIAALSVAALLVSGDAALAEKRVAFVVGNAAYRNVPQLPNPAIDAKAIAAVLRNVGFEVVEGTNLTRDKMTEKLLDFGKKAEGADVAVFFYAGHGIAVNNTNYLLPIDADLKSEMDVKLGAAINVDLTLEQTMGDAKVKLVFLDACRDNPFAARIRSAKATRSVAVNSGLAEMKSGQGTLLAFATGPGQTALDGEAGTHSPFTRALISNITKPGVEIQQAMTRVRAQVNEETNKNQLPWGHTNLIGEVYLSPQAATADTAAASTGTPVAVNTVSAPATAMEVEFWRSVKDSNKPEELNAYLNSYPNGAFKALALGRIAKLQDNGQPGATRNLTTGIDPDTFTKDADQTSEDQLGLDRGQRRDVQRRLTGLGFDTKATGKFDDNTRAVIKRWQAQRGYPVTGYLNTLQHKALLGEIVSTRVASSDDSASSSDDDSGPSSGGGRRYHRSGGGGGRHYRGGGGGGLFGHMMGGMFR